MMRKRRMMQFCAVVLVLPVITNTATVRAGELSAEAQVLADAQVAPVIQILQPDLPDLDQTLWDMAYPLVMQAVRETGMDANSENVLTSPVFTDEDQLVWTLTGTRSNIASRRLIATFSMYVENAEDTGLSMTVTVVEMGEQVSTTSHWSDSSIRSDKIIYDVVPRPLALGTTDTPPGEQQALVVSVGDQVQLETVAKLSCKCDNSGGSGCKKADCAYIKACPNPPKHGIHSCAYGAVVASP